MPHVQLLSGNIMVLALVLLLILVPLRRLINLVMILLERRELRSTVDLPLQLLDLH